MAFMGDTGLLALAGALGSLSLITKRGVNFLFPPFSPHCFGEDVCIGAFLEHRVKRPQDGAKSAGDT